MPTPIGIDHFLQTPDGTVIARGQYVQAVHTKKGLTHRGYVTDIFAKPGVLWIMDETSGAPKMLDITDYEVSRAPSAPRPA
ncbi:hypothetical protein [Kocuria sp. U4B]